MSSASNYYDIPVSSSCPGVCSGYQNRRGKSLDFSHCVHFQKHGTLAGSKAVLVSAFSSPVLSQTRPARHKTHDLLLQAVLLPVFLICEVGHSGLKPEIFLDYSLTPISNPSPCLSEPLPTSLDFFQSAVLQVYYLFKWECDATKKKGTLMIFLVVAKLSFHGSAIMVVAFSFLPSQDGSLLRAGTTSYH